MSKEQSERSSEEEEQMRASSTFEPFFEVGPIIFSGDSSISTTPGASAIASASGSVESTNPDLPQLLENVPATELWAQYIKCLMMAAPSNVGRVEFQSNVGLEAEKYLEKLLKILPVSSTTEEEKPLRVPCFNPADQNRIGEDEKYKVEILRATKADGEIIWTTAAHLQALVLIRKSKESAVGLNELIKFNTALQEAADVYRGTMTSSQDRSVSRVGNFQYRVSYAGRTEIFHAEFMRNLILDQLPSTFRFFTQQTKTERLKSVLYELKEKRKRRH
uniref:Uncharacterized protein n=1 Tax=Onchocerca volvulus TaxID=6282 RepID=A0A8R1TPM8_ONCVO